MSEKLQGRICFVGIGSNVGQAADHCRDAIERIASFPGIRLMSRSSLYHTEPAGFPQQPWFVNGVIEIRTDLTARDLLKALKTIEQNLGRQAGPKWGPRIIDLDILFYGQEMIHEENLMIPHPELHKRRFVLVPLQEIAGYVIHPSFGVSIKGLIDRLEDTGQIILIED